MRRTVHRGARAQRHPGKGRRGQRLVFQVHGSHGSTDRALVTSKLEGQSFGHYAYGWDPEGDFYTEHYYREHLTTSGGWWGKQRTVSDCVRFELESGSAIATSVDCPDGSPYSYYTDEWVVVA